MTKTPKTIAIIGGGLTGLVAARRARQRWPKADIAVLEASDRTGGILRTDVVDGYRLEGSADMFTTEPTDALELVESLGKSAELVTTRPVKQRAFVATDSGIEPVPSGFALMLPNDLQAIRDSRIFDQEGVARLLDERNVPAKKGSDDEDLQSFVVRRFGQQAFDRLIQPLVSGIYTADPKRLGMNATMKRFVDMEQQHGSLIAAAENSLTNDPHTFDRNASGARYDLFRAPANGMGSLIDWLLQDLQAVNSKPVNIRLNWPVAELVRQSNSHWTVHSQLPNQNSLECEAVVLAVNPAVASRVLAREAPSLAKCLKKIESASAAVVTLAFDESQLFRPISAFGIVVPASLQRKLIAASFTSNKFPGRAPAGKLLVRCFIGGALQGELVDLTDDALIALATNELGRLIAIEGAPELTAVRRWRNAMPQYHVGHLDWVARIEDLVSQVDGLELAGNGYRGVGIPICIRSGQAAIERLMD